MATIKLAKKLSKLPPLPAFDDAEQKTLDAGKFLKRIEKKKDASGNTVGTGTAYMIVDRPPQDVWDRILDFDTYAEYYPNIASCRVYKQEKNEIFAEFNMKVGLVLKIRFHVHHTFEPSASRLAWHLDQDKKNDFADNVGSWTVWPHGKDRSLIGYAITLDSGRPIPKMVEDMIAQSGIPKVMESVKKRVESDGKYTR